MKPDEVPMPERVKKLPTFRGYPITFVTFVGEDNAKAGEATRTDWYMMPQREK